MRTRGCWLAGLLGLGVAAMSWAADSVSPKPVAAARIHHVVKNQDFRILAHPRRSTPGQTEVVVFFWYGSPWAARAEPALRAWVEQGRAPSNVVVRFVPVVNQADWAFSARVFYALDRLGLERSITPRLLQAVQRKAVDLQSPRSVLAWLQAQGVPGPGFEEAINHPLVVARVSGLPLVARAHEVRSIPTFVIDGRYHIAATDRVTPERAAAVAMFMAEKLSQGGSRP